MCADGSKERVYITKEESSSPTIGLEDLFTTLVIDAEECMDVAILDVPGAYLNAQMPENKFKLIKFENEFVDMMCNENELFKECVKFIVVADSRFKLSHALLFGKSTKKR